MKTIEQIINQKIEEGKGNVLAICPTDSMITSLEKNDAITVCDVLSNPKQNGEGKRTFRQKTFNFKKMRKKFKKKRKDMIIGEVTELSRYMKTFVRDSIYITKGTIFLFIQNPDYDYDLLVKRYKRFGIDCVIEKCDDGILFTMEVGQAKNHFWKEKIYYIIDILIEMIDLIGDVLIN